MRSGSGRTAVVAHPEAPVGADAARRYRADLERRAAGEPVAYLRGIKEFYGLAFEADARALIPRPETETLVELATDEVMRRLGSSLRPAGARHLRVVDVGTGSGAIAVALAVSLRRLDALDAVELPGRRHLARRPRPRPGERGRPRGRRPDHVRRGGPAARR